MKNFIYVFLTLLMVVSSFAEDTSNISVDDLMSMELEELLNMEIVTATKKGQKISQSPAIISTLTGKEIEELGITNLYEALSYMPGIEIMETYYGYTDVQFRGILQPNYNNKAVLLLNGQPLCDQFMFSYYLEQIPILSIERIEIIRGPGGVLYGTNAFAGVINIITKDGEKVNGTKSSFRYGSFSTNNLEFNGGKKVNGLDLFFAGEYNESKGYPKDVMYDEDDTTFGGYFGHSPGGGRKLGAYSDDPDAYENDYVNLFGSLGYKGFKLNAVYFENEKDKFGIIPSLTSTGERRLQGSGVNLKYVRPNFLNDRLGVNSIIWYDRIEKLERIGRYPPILHAPTAHADNEGYSGNKTGGQIEFNYTFIPDKVGVLTGIGHEYSHADPYRFFYADSFSSTGEQIQDPLINAFAKENNTNNLWGYIQFDIFPIKEIEMIAGTRYNNNKQAGGILIYNVGTVYSPLDNLSFKLLCGSGFRNPSFFEKYNRGIDVLAGFEKLKPEKINTIDFGIDYILFKSYSLRLNSFYNRTNDLISRRDITQQDLNELNSETGYGSGVLRWTKGKIYTNKEGETYKGLEMEFKGKPHNTLNFFANLSYKTGKDAQDKDLLFFSSLLGNCGITVKPVSLLSISPTIQYIGERKGHYKPLYPWNKWKESDYTLSAYTLLNLNITFRPVNEISLSLYGANLLDEEYFYPEYIRQSIPSIPGGPGRAFYFKLGYNL